MRIYIYKMLKKERGRARGEVKIKRGGRGVSNKRGASRFSGFIRNIENVNIVEKARARGSRENKTR